MSQPAQIVTGTAIALLVLGVLPVAWPWSWWSALHKFSGEWAAANEAGLTGHYEEVEPHLQVARSQIGFFGAPQELLRDVLYEEAELYLETRRPVDAEKVIRDAM